MSLLVSARKNRWILLLSAALFLAAQLGIATHSLHLDSRKAESSCSFCSTDTNLETPTASDCFVSRLVNFAPVEIAVRSVHERQPVLSPRLSRGPPRSSQIV